MAKLKRGILSNKKGAYERLFCLISILKKHFYFANISIPLIAVGNQTIISPWPRLAQL